MIKKLFSLPLKTLLIIVVLLIAAGVFAYNRSSNDDEKAGQAEAAKYLNFDGRFVFSVPESYSVDEQSVPGAQLIYTGTIAAKIVDDVYNAGGIAVQAIPNLTDHSSKGFKDYVNNTYVVELKKNISPTDVDVKFGKANGDDNARITAKKDGKNLRFIYLKGGQHPAQVVSKSENSQAKKIAETIIDVEASNLKDEEEPLKQALKNVAQLVKDQKAAELYNSAAPALQAENTQQELATALKTAAPYLAGNIAISGGSHTSDGFNAAVRFTPLDPKNQQPTFGSMALKKIDGQWKLEQLTLPSPTPQ